MWPRARCKKALQAELIVDAILGTGFKPPLKGIGRKAVEVINECSSAVLAIDLPSGAYTDSFLPAEAQGLTVASDAVITFTAPKPVHAFGGITQGPIAVADIGSPEQLLFDIGKLKIQIRAEAYVNLVFRPREPDANKGDFGHILVIGGSTGKAGAAAMAGMAALRTGAGLVTVACPRTVQPTVAAFAPELMTEALPETQEGTISLAAMGRLEQLLPGKDVIVLGPGLSRNAETGQLVRQLLPKLSASTVIIDADGLNAFAAHAEALRREGGLILTPHPGEMSRLTGIATDEIQRDRVRVAREVAKKHEAVVVLKGHRTITAVPSGEVWVNMSGNPGMAKGGAGDVLAGVVATTVQMQPGGFFRRARPEMMELMKRRDAGDVEAQRQLEEHARAISYEWVGMIVATAVYLHGLAGDVARDLHGEHSMLATDIIEGIGDAIAVCSQEPEANFVYLQR